MEHFEVIVIGGGSAGLAASIALGRSRRSVLVIDEGQPRNAPAQHAHNVLGQEGISPLELLERGRVEAQEYGVRIINSAVDSLTGSLNDGFAVRVADQEFSAQRIVLATGLKDELPQIPGLEQAWGTSAIHCAYCHGWEVRDQEIVVIGCGPMSTHQAMMFQQLSSKITFVDHDPSELNEEGTNLLAKLGMPVVRQSIAQLAFDQTGQLESVKLENNEELTAQSVIVAGRMNANADLYLELGGALTEHPLGTFIKVNETGATDIPGVYAVGNASNLGAMVMAAAASGTLAGAAINAELLNAKLANA
ncbi:NAD(P)/FAD-dependent oxidoreductase [Glutamicibacter ectropisis]|uniref:NAD(P)/FAD-dependent oxidoreductase n=1 Tax=Glutamicibacter ectropisis TaxID=3046593 RepID=A0AAU6W9V7_9MICC